MSDVELTALCDINKERLINVTSKYRVKNIYTDFREMIDNVDIDAVSIVLPDHLHKDPGCLRIKM